MSKLCAVNFFPYMHNFCCAQLFAVSKLCAVNFFPAVHNFLQCTTFGRSSKLFVVKKMVAAKSLLK